MPLLKKGLKNDILHLQLDDPGTKNSFSPAMAQEFAEALKAHDCKALVVSASGATFCAGGNLKFYKNLKTKEEGLAINKEIAQTLDHLSQLPVLKVAVVQGACYGGGVEFLSCFDSIIASPSSLFGLWQRRVGLSYGWGGKERLLKRIPEQKLKTWLLSAETLSSYQACDLGLVDRIELKALEKAMELCEKTLRWGDNSLKEIMQSEGDEAFEKLWLAEEHRKILKSFS